MRKALNGLGYPIGLKKTKQLMKEVGVFVRYPKKYKVTTNSKHMFYNSYRLHSYLGYMNPNQFESEWIKMKKVA